MATLVTTVKQPSPNQRKAVETWSSTDLEFRPRFKRKSASKSRKPTHQLLLPNSKNEEFKLGVLWIGTTNNVVPENYNRCSIEFPDNSESMILNLDDLTVVVNVTGDVEIIKDVVKSKVFAGIIGVEDGVVKVELYFLSLPLTKFNGNTGKTIKTILSITCNANSKSVEDGSNGINNTEMLYSEIRKKQNDLIEHLNKSEILIKNDNLKPVLRPYQKQAVNWMLYREKETPNVTHQLHPLCERITLTSGTQIYFNCYTGYVDITPPEIEPLRSGGILADEMGLGKTVEVLACLLSNPKPDSNIATHTKTTSSPVVIKQPKKRKVNEECDYSVDDLKRVKVSNGYWEIGELPERIQCVCGTGSKDDVYSCTFCGKKQHGVCLGYKRSFGEYICPQCWMKQPLLESKATLIVCPSTLRKQWIDEVCKHVKGDFKVFNYEGSSAVPVYPTTLQHYDLVLTTYNILQSDLRLSTNIEPISLRRQPKYSPPGSPISRIYWWRLCLDEAQTVETSRMVSEMAQKLVARHRWAVTGTPFSKDISDLYCLLDYLQFAPYSEIDTWNYLLYKPYLCGDKEALEQFMSKVLWRTAKSFVLDQIGIPKQTTQEHFLKFSAVEKYFYKREHELCCKDFLLKLRKLDVEVPLKQLDKSTLKNVLAPLLTLRQACTHPNAVKGRYLATKKNVSSMQDLLDALILKNSNEAEESLRVVISACNGLAGIYLLLQQPEKSVDEYRKILQLAARFGEDQPEPKLKIDKLQLIHAMYNLSEVLSLKPNVQPTLRDHKLKEECLDLEQKYMQKFANQTILAYEEQEAFKNKVEKTLQKFSYPRDKWYCDLINWVDSNDLMQDFKLRLDAVHEIHQVQDTISKPTKSRLSYVVATWDEDIFAFREETKNAIDGLYEINLEERSLFVSQDFVKAAADCHLRPVKNAKIKQKCPVCVANDCLLQYELKLFSQKKRSEEVKSNEGAWKASQQELILRALAQLATAKDADADLLQDAKIHLKLIETLKKEFKEVRKLWTYLDQQICAKDELDMCKIRLQLKQPNVEGTNKPNRTDAILKKLTYIQENRLETIHLLAEHELHYHKVLLVAEEKQNLAKLEKCIGTYSYLETLRKQQYAGQSPDPCPICHGVLNDHWSILPCGHCYCLECIEVLFSKVQIGEHIICAVCRQKEKIEDVSYIKVGEKGTDDQNDEFKVHGNFSVKIEAIVKLVMKLRKQNETVKVLIFSTWTSILQFLNVALQKNNIKSAILKQQTVDTTLTKFKDKNQHITALLLPINLGAKGINLIEATHVILAEPLLNPSDELQAIGRVHRIGQTKSTVVHKFVVENTIEESIHKAISSNAEDFDKNKLTLGQLKNLFTSMQDAPIEDSIEDDLEAEDIFEY